MGRVALRSLRLRRRSSIAEAPRPPSPLVRKARATALLPWLLGRRPTTTPSRSFWPPRISCVCTALCRERAAVSRSRSRVVGSSKPSAPMTVRGTPRPLTRVPISELAPGAPADREDLSARHCGANELRGAMCESSHMAPSNVLRVHVRRTCGPFFTPFGSSDRREHGSRGSPSRHDTPVRYQTPGPSSRNVCGPNPTSEHSDRTRKRRSSLASRSSHASRRGVLHAKGFQSP